MSSIVEFEGKTVEEALKKATEKLNLPSGKLKHDVISHGSTGIFGLVGTKKARIRVAVPDETQLKSTEKEPEEIDTSSAGVIALVEEAFNEEGDSADAGESTELGKTALQKIVDLITSDATIAVSRKGEKIVLSITGGNTAIMIGKRGQTLEAMQYLVEKIVNKQSEKRVRVEIDVEGYLEDKREKLEKLALELSEKVKKHELSWSDLFLFGAARVLNGEQDGEVCPLTKLTLDRESSSQFLNESIGDREAEAGPLLPLGREEGLEHSLEVLARNSATVVCDSSADLSLADPAQLD